MRPEVHGAYRTGRVLTEGADLYYEIRGEGEPLLMISGGGGDAGMYAAAADLLADRYTVITYDRRGNSRSTCPTATAIDMRQQARDALAVLHAAGYTSAHVFGNSGGADIALELATSQPQSVKTVVVHEPPAVRVLPDRDKWLRFFQSVHRSSRWFGTTIAMIRFLRTVPMPPQGPTAAPPGFATRMRRNNQFFVQYEILPFVNYEPDIQAIRQNGVKVVMAVGRVTLDAGCYFGRTVPILADLLGCGVVVFPGHHVSFQDLPVEWSAMLRSIL